MTVYLTIFITAMVIWTVIILYLIHLDRKMRELVKKMSIIELEQTKNKEHD